MVDEPNIIFKQPQKPEAKVIAKKLDDLTDKTNTVIFKTSSIFPFSFPPDDLIIQPLKVDIVEREFFASEIIRSFPFDQIVETQVLSGPIFATLRIIGKGLQSETVRISYLKKADAKKAKNIIDGFVLCKNNNIDLTKLDPDNLDSKIEELGTIPEMPPKPPLPQA